jgi:hypothetical protein
MFSMLRAAAGSKEEMLPNSLYLNMRLLLFSLPLLEEHDASSNEGKMM